MFNDSNTTIGDVFGDKLNALKMKLEGINPDEGKEAEMEESERIINNVNMMKEFYLKNADYIKLGEGKNIFYVPEFYFTLSGSMSQDPHNCKVLSNSIFTVFKFPALIVKADTFTSVKQEFKNIHPVIQIMGGNSVEYDELVYGKFPFYGDANLIPQATSYSLIRDVFEPNAKVTASLKVDNVRYIVVPLLPSGFYDNFYPESELWDVIKEN